MKKVFSIIYKLFVWAIVGLFSVMFALALLIRIVKEDLFYRLFIAIGFCKVRIVLLRVGRRVVVSDGLSL